jgi:hypothetical protein
MENPYQSPLTAGQQERTPKPITWRRRLIALVTPLAAGAAVGILIPRISAYIRALWDAYAP